MIITILIWVALFNRKMIKTILVDGLSSFIYASNWWFIFHKLSYFDSFGSPSPFKNLWSLAIEEQFYIICPFMMIIGLKIYKRKVKFANIVLVAALSSAALMGILYKPGIDPSRIYYGTDTRAFELLIGSWLAIICPMKRFLSVKSYKGQREVLNIVGTISFAIFIISVVCLNEYQVFLYRGGMLLISLNAAVLIVCVCHLSSYLGQLFSWKPLSWVGKRSYGIYLWHYPVIILSTPVYEIGNPLYWHVLVQLAGILFLSELSYRFIETPIRKQGFREFLKNCMPISNFLWERVSFTRVGSFIAVLSILAFVTIGCTMAVKGEHVEEKIEMHQVEVIEKNEEQQSADKNSNVTSNEEKESSTSPNSKSYNKILAIGDSIMLDISQELNKRYPNIKIDGKVGRQLYQAVALAPKYADFNAANNAVIIELGTNSYFTDKQIDSLINSFSKAHIYLVNVRVPRQWEREVNKALARKAQENENITLVDWYSTAIKHPEYFENDGVHLKTKGAEALTSLIVQALTENNK